MRRSRSRTAWRGQSMLEWIILVAVLVVALAWVPSQLPQSMQGFYNAKRDYLASPM